MQLELENVGKRYGREWIFRGLRAPLPAQSHTLLVGPNGSGKSTLLQVISGFITASEGTLTAEHPAGRPIEEDDYFKHLSLAAPYLDLFEDLTLEESIAFQSRFRPFRQQLSTDSIVEILQLEAHRNKAIKYYSSGMRQRVRLGLAILTDAPLLLLDEPTSNLDRAAIDWYRALLASNSTDRTVIVSSNHNPDDYIKADLTIDITDYKKK